MNLSNYQVSSHQQASSKNTKLYPSLRQQLDQLLKEQSMHVQSNVTICCRIKRPTYINESKGSRNKDEMLASGVSIYSKRSLSNNRQNTLRSSAQSFSRQLMSSSARSHHSNRSGYSSHSESRKSLIGPSKRSSSAFNMYSNTSIQQQRYGPHHFQ